MRKINFFTMNVPNVMGRVYSNKILYDYRDGNKIIYASMVAQDRFIPFLKREFEKSNSINCSGTGKYLNTSGCNYDFIQKKDPTTDYTHLIAYRKEKVFQLDNGTNMLEIPIILKENEKMNKILYNKLYKFSSIPILEEWMNELKEELIEDGHIRAIKCLEINEDTLKGYMLRISDMELQKMISKLLKKGILNINKSNDKSDIIDMVDGLDSYLNFYGDILATKIQEAFVPKYDPESTKYSNYVNNYDDSCFYNGIELYKAQKSTIQASVNNFKKNDVTLVIGEMGCGKTAIGAGIAYADYKKKVGMTSIVMCPSHLVNKWKNEIERFVPNSKAYIVKDIAQLIALESKIKALVKTEHTFIILSKEIAKSTYEMRPAVNWSISKKTFVCPCCGQPLTKKVKYKVGRTTSIENVKFDKLDMLTQKAYNTTCMNEVEVIIKATGEKKKIPCNSLLWTPVNKEEKNPKWLKLGSAGWIIKSHINSIYDDLERTSTNLSKKERQLFDKVLEYKELIKLGEEYKGMKAPRKYSIAKYIRQHYKGYIDYFLADELHLYKGDSKQGQAMADIATASNKVIGLTGTLLNGYADGLFYILYRLFPRTMKKEGFDYYSEMEFMRQFGVIKKETSFGVGRTGRRREKISTNEKRLPGVSPLVFTKFLLENAVFISLSDMDGGLPAYQEFPIAIPMDDDLKNAYQDLENQFSDYVSTFETDSSKVLGSMLQVLSTYPDMPYNQEEIYNPETNQLAVTPINLEEGLRNKENRLLELVQEKKAKGEKVLVYYEWTKKTDLGIKLPKMLEDNGIKTAVLTSSVSADTREEWIEKKLKQGIDVLICNPKLVETGLDLLDFTTIVFYQLGYNIFTMRQASRRSWRLSQTKDIEVYFMYYEGTIQEKAISLMATKLQASMAIEGKFSEEGLRAMSDNEDLLSKIANSVVEGIKDTVEVIQFTAIQSKEREHESRIRIPISSLLYRLPQVDILSFMKRDYEKGRKLNSNKTIFKELANSKLLVGNLL